MSKNGDIIAGLDIGSAQTVIVIGKRTESNGGLTVMGAGRIPCRGLRGGVVVNIPESRMAIGRAAEDAEDQSKESIQSLLVGVRGSHVETYNHRGAITISRTDKEITAEDVDNVIVNAKAIQLSSDREIIHTVPLRLPQVGTNSGLNVSMTKTRAVGACSISNPKNSRVEGSAQ